MSPLEDTPEFIVPPAEAAAPPVATVVEPPMPLRTPAGYKRIFWAGQHDSFVPGYGVFARYETILLPEAEAVPLLASGWRDADLPTQPPPEPPAALPPRSHPLTVTVEMTSDHARRFEGRIYIPGERLDVPEDRVAEFTSTGFFALVEEVSLPPEPEEGLRTLRYEGPEGRSIPGAGLFETQEEVEVSGPRARLLLRSGLFNDVNRPDQWLAFNVPPPEAPE